MTAVHHDEPVLGWLDGRPLARTELDRRLAALRGGPRSGALPAPGSAEDRQLTRWVAQVVLTERLCTAEAAARGLDVTGAPPARLDQLAAVELGSITAAAFEGCAAVRALYENLTADVTVPTAQIAAYRAAKRPRPPGVVWRLSAADGDFDAAPDTLPAALTAALRAATPGDTVTAGEWTVVLRDRRESVDPAPDPTDRIIAAARRAVFVRWLDHARAHRLRLVPGLEHPGDPQQPDNHHRH
ncbi:hypothetical protein QTQ03_07620 [Micromonospora sp. WMMA1363]|uniref:DUF7158 domain-containing protein n=1 Tax=Micromonospora sp. WMMA1363 TaxID=3053985 RepID=UPI00259C6E65|nr:hypothetical protein [Micromonospora sp. WMMA1363]MDM4719471.1 hypothetical protein [Micromonospora sp. WMMA1363]